jgi:hypothetical protein
LATNSGAKPTTVAPSIVGRWKEPKGSDTTEFHADGRVTEKPAGAADILGRYLFDGAKLEIRLEGVAEELVFSVALKGNSLEMTGPDGEKTRYERVS